MKQRLSDYVADFLVSHGIKHCFSVVGGGAMHLNDALGHKDGLKVIYTHHEQAAAIAAESYARLDNNIAAVCVTTGPGGVNALTGVLCGWLDSIPMFIISGQVRYDTTARYAKKLRGINLRALGDQEYDIINSVKAMTKYAVMIENPERIKYELERAYHLATTGRPGPVWLDIPVNFQGAYIETSNLESYDPSEDDKLLPPAVSDDVIKNVISLIKESKRPVLYAGYGIRLSGGYEIFRQLIEKLNIPVVTYWNAIDLIEDSHRLYTGRGGNMGDRAGNFAVQNSDLVLAIGTRLSIRQVGYNWDTWARAAKIIMVDIDKNEMNKHTIHADFKIWADAKDFMNKLNSAIDHKIFNDSSWLEICSNWKKNYPVVLTRHYEQKDFANVYAFIDYLSSKLHDKNLTVVSNGACCVAGSQAYRIKKDARFINNSATASMGYGLPASIGACVNYTEGGGGSTGARTQVICLEGDGSIMMNLQELQTVITNKLPIKIFLVNNQGYHSIRQTQRNLFSNHTRVGIGPESGDLSFPDFSKIAEAFGYKYLCAHDNSEMKRAVDEALNFDGALFCEIFTDTVQNWEPKSSARRLEDGTLVSSPLEDLAPFLPREELKRNMFIPLIDE